MLSMIVDRISLTPRYAFKAPGIAPHAPPPTIPARSTRGTSTTGGRPGTARAVTVARSAPATIWPSPPMLMTRARNEMQMPVPTSSSGIAFTAVSARSCLLPNAPVNSALYPVNGLAPRATIMIAPMPSAAATAATAIAAR